MVLNSALAESSSQATQMILRAFRMLPMPRVTAVLGGMSLWNKSAVRVRESLPNSIRRHALLRAEPGSLKASEPSGFRSHSTRSSPPASMISRSKDLHWLCVFSLAASRLSVWILPGSISTLSYRCSLMSLFRLCSSSSVIPTSPRLKATTSAKLTLSAK